MLNRSILCVLWVSLSLGSERKDPQITSRNITFIGTSFNIVEHGDSPIHYIWLHGDEKTAQMALNYHIKKYSGKAFFIQNDSREIPYQETQIDPNRIFSRNGSFYALTKFKLDWSPGTLRTALDELDDECQQFLEELIPDTNGILIAVHNNSRGYNVNKELKRSKKASIKKRQNPRDFILCTHEKDFEILSEGPYNVVLQNELPASDDGSLSWESIRRNIRYVNVETRLGYLSKQKKMLEFIRETLN